MEMPDFLDIEKKITQKMLSYEKSPGKRYDVKC